MSVNWALWDFPCDYNLKVIGSSRYPLKDIVTDIVAQHVPNFDPSKISIRPSKKGNYHALTVHMPITEKTQLINVYQALHQRKEILQAF